MFQSDLVGIIIVYFYVTIMLIFTEKILHKYPSISRKILHIMVGNIAFLLPIFETKEAMSFLAAGPFILFTYLTSPHSPLKSIKGKTSSAGHSMGLVYYAITWTILAYIFFDNMIIIAIGILSMSYGDGLASLVGIKYGKRIYNISGDQKSLVGSFAMFIFTFIMFLIAILIYSNIFSYDIVISNELIFYLFLISIIAAILEGITPKGLDNITVPLLVSFLYWLLII